MRSACRDQSAASVSVSVYVMMHLVSLNLYWAIHGSFWIIFCDSLGKLVSVRGGKMYFKPLPLHINIV